MTPDFHDFRYHPGRSVLTSTNILTVTRSIAIFALLLFFTKAMPQDSLPEIRGLRGSDSLVKDTSIAHDDSLPKSSASIQNSAALEKIGIENAGLTNIVLADKKKPRANGWGEYRIKGKCLCCDNMVDGDCIIVWNTERTDNQRITQIVDGKIEGDLQDETTYFGALKRREHETFVTFLMAEITIKEMQEIRKIVVYTITDKEKKANYLTNCQLGYYDQFDRLQWGAKVERKKLDEPISFVLERPILTKKILLKIEDGKNIITEVAIFRQD